MRRETLNGGRVVVVGGGVIGTSIAFHLGERGYRDITVLERGLPGEGTTADATGGIRQQFSTRVNIELARRSLPFWRHFEERTGAPMDFRQHGYLFLISDPDTLDVFERNAELQRSLGVDVQVLDPQQAADVHPGVRTDDLLGATYSAEDGSASPADAVAGYLRGAAGRGVEVRRNTEFLGLVTDAEGAVRAVRTSAGTLDAELVVLAAGPQVRDVGRLCGVDIPVDPHPRQAFATAPLPELHGGLPLAVDMASGAYVHPEAAGTAIIGGNDRDAPSSDRAAVDWSRVESLAAALTHRFPRLEGLEVTRGWAGLREMTADDHAIVGPVDEVPGLWVAAGFSGHGFMQSPAVGEALAEWWLTGAPPLDLSALRLSRFADQSLELETAVF
ncbi:NAD(P)/FAD-dependent oxidoreductase [Streptomyces fulvoviolaceus]|uniref:NAD(P)/FAD-dependent oxidoreductase n=1 Tax=Streptomyces fulvoviolaceus TaxID=285535 RepID=UPI0021C0E1C4|nr:FAD-binding oxidoreductase [Streptomyces fulvoviolaceus]MCT9082084.1 FAD-binding oxidoreductase [Streptomyces fulvoviolaceus]